MYPNTAKTSGGETLIFLKTFACRLGLLPNTQSQSKRNVFRVYFGCAIFIATTILVLVVKEKRGFTQIGGFVVLHQLCDLTLMTVIVFAIWQLGVNKFAETQLLFRLLEQFAAGVQTAAAERATLARCKLFIGVYFLLLILSVIGTHYVWSLLELEYNFFETEFVGYIFIAYIQMLIVLMRHAWRIVQQTYAAFNRTLAERHLTALEANRLIVDHANMADCVGLLNEVFGGVLFLITLEEVFNILNTLNFDIAINNGNVTAVRYLFLSWSVIIIVQGVVVATMCEKVVDEGRRTITLTYKALYRYSNAPAVRDKLFILAHQATARCPQFSAAGFFNVDFAMLFTFVNLITTYVIVIIQFSGNK